MSLNFYFDKLVRRPDDLYIPDPDNPGGRDVLNWKYSVIIMPGTMLVQIGKLDQKTIPEFYARINLYERMMGTLTRGPHGAERFIPLEDIVALEGLYVNVTTESRAKFVNHMVKAEFMDSQVRQATKEMGKLIEARAETMAEELRLNA